MAICEADILSTVYTFWVGSEAAWEIQDHIELLIESGSGPDLGGSPGGHD